MTARQPPAWAPRGPGALGRDRGAAVVELVLLTPLLILIMLMIAACARITTARLHVTQAAPAAARAATLARSPAAARQQAAESDRQALTGAGRSCITVATQVQGDGWRPGGTVVVRVTCTVSLARLSPLHLAVSRDVSATATSVIDRWRSAP